MAGEMESWQPYSKYVQSGLTDGKFHSATFLRIASGPPRLTNIGGAAAASALFSSTNTGDIVYPMGLIQNFTKGENKNISRIFEIGSERSYFISGRTVGQLSMSSIMYDGPSLLRRLYAYYEDSEGPVQVPPVFPNVGSDTMANPHDVKIPPGYENIYLNLASDLFSQPVGLLVYMKDNNEDTIAANYFESVYVPTHNIGTDAQGVIQQESVSLQYERMVPVAVNALELITYSPTDIAA